MCIILPFRRNETRQRSAERSAWPPDYVERFWAAYPRRVSKQCAIDALDEVRRSGEISFPDLIASVEKFAKAVADKNIEFVPFAARWLKERRWEWLIEHFIWVPVASWTLHKHEKDGPPTLRIEYAPLVKWVPRVSEWLALQHGGTARDIASAKWEALGGAIPAPETVKDAVLIRDVELDPNPEIAIRHDGQCWRVVDRRAWHRKVLARYGHNA